MCTIIKQEFDEKKIDFFNVSSNSKHKEIFKLLEISLKEYKPDQQIQIAFNIWNQNLAPIVLALPQCDKRQQYGNIAKLLAACLFDSDEYSKAVVCLGHVVQLNSNDLHARLLLIYWLCFLGHWSLAKKQLRQKQLSGSVCSMQNIIEEIIENLILLHTQELKEVSSGNSMPLHEGVFELIRSFENTLSKSKNKTFQQYEAQIIMKLVCIAASHFSSVELTLVGDPLQNMDVIKARYETLMKCRSDAFYRDQEDDHYVNEKALFSEHPETQGKTCDDYLKLTAVVAEHFDAVLQLCYKYIEFGILREAECEALKLLLQSLKLGSLQRSLAILNVLHLTAIYGNGDGNSLRLDAYRSIVFHIWDYTAKDNLYWASAEMKNIVPESSGQQNGLELRRNEQISECDIQSCKQRAELDEHEEDCGCMICSLSNIKPRMRIEAIFSKFLFYRFSTKNFRLLSQRIEELHRENSVDLSMLHSALQTEKPNDANAQKYPLNVLNLFLIAAICWLQRVRDDEKAEIVKQVIKESLKICSLYPVQFRSHWLTIRQLSRLPLSIPKFEWLQGNDASIKPGLRSPLKSIICNLASELSNLTLCSPRSDHGLNMSSNKPLTGTTKKNQRFPNSSNSELEEARNDFHSFSHLFYREWRFEACSYLGQFFAFQHDSETEWSAAYYFNEAICICTRQLGRMTLRNSENKEDFYFKDIEEFKNSVSDLPSDITVIQLFMDSRRILWLLKLHNSRPPLIVPIAFISQDDEILKRVSQLLLENDIIGNWSKTCTDPKQFWEKRRNLDSEMKTLIGDVETKWFGIFRYLLQPCTTLSTARIAVTEEIMCSGFSRSAANALAENLHLRVSEWKRFVQRLVAVEGLDEAVAMHICDCRSRWVSNFSKECFIPDLSNNYILLCLSPQLTTLPFELLPFLETHKRICRIPSFFMFQRLLTRSREIPKAVDGTNSFYVLDPGGDLTETQKRLSTELQKRSYWKGTIGAAPKPEELRDFLQTCDLFFYMGHGSGGRYFGRSAVLRSDCRAVSILMGCSSVRILSEGGGFDGKGAIYDYMIAKCPCVVGCLWMVTDGEIDKVLLGVLRYCFSEIGRYRGEVSSSYRLLIDGIAYARTACKLKYMTGGSVVAYGLPIVTHFPKLIRKKKQRDEQNRIAADIKKVNGTKTARTIKPSSC